MRRCRGEATRNCEERYPFGVMALSTEAQQLPSGTERGEGRAFVVEWRMGRVLTKSLANLPSRREMAKNN